MAADSQALKFVDWTEQARDAFERVRQVEPFSAGMCSIENLLDGCFLAEAPGRGLVAVRPIVHPRGRLELCVAAAVSHGGARPASFWAFGAVERLAQQHGAEVISMATPHDSLARAAVRAGWTQAGYIVRKVYGVQ